jgi:hypothetical protein
MNSSARTAVLIGVAAVVALVALRPRNRTPDTAPDNTAVVAANGQTLAARDPILDSLILTVHKSPTCGCCKKWVDHMEANGFKVVTVDHPDVNPIKKELGVKPELQSCHTSKIGTYVIEGHVPAEDVIRLLKEKPDVFGLAVPDMPNGSPGMEGLVKEKYDVLLIEKNGATRVFSSR